MAVFVLTLLGLVWIIGIATMEDSHFSFKAYVITSVVAFFLIFPFLLYLIMIANKLTYLINPILLFPIIVVAGLGFAFYVDKVTRTGIPNYTKHILFVILFICISVYAIFLLYMTWIRYTDFISEVIDLHYFHQVIWELSEFKIPYVWILDQPAFPVWSQHFSPILIFLAPLYWFVKDAWLLMLVQAVAVISGAYPIYLIAKHTIKSRSIGLALAFAYLAFGGLQFGFAYGFHEIMFFPPLFLWAYYFHITKKVKRYLLFIFLSLLVKEEVAFIIAAWSIYLLVVKREKFFGLTTAAFALFWYIVCFHIIFPLFTNGQGFGYWNQYGEYGKFGIFGIIQFALLHPIDFLLTLVTPYVKVETFLQIFGAFSFLIFLYPPSLLIVTPSLLEKLLSSNIAMAYGAHYSAAITAVTIVSTYEAFLHFYKYKFIMQIVHNRNIFFSVLILYIALFSNIFYGYRGYSLIPEVHTSLYERGLSSNNLLVLNKILDALPEKATVSAQYQIVPHIKKHYKMMSTWPGMTGKEDFIIINTELLPVLGAKAEDYNNEIEKLNKNENYQLAINQDGVLIYRKKSFTLSE